MIKAVIVDVDDTLCLTEAACFAMENETLQSMGHAPMSRELHVKTWGQPLFEAITVRSPGIDVSAFRAAYQPVIARYIAEGKLDAIPTANYRALDELLAMGKSLFVLTSRTRSELQHLLAPDHLLAAKVKAFYYKDTMQYHKPDPRAFTELLVEHGFEPAQCLYVGDSVGDSEAATQAGLKFVASLESGLRQKSDFASQHVDAFIGSFSELPAAVHGIDALLTK